MRALWKLSVIVLLGVAIQCVLVRWAGEIDEAAFVFRVLVARVQGIEADDPRLVEDAERLLHRQCARDAVAIDRRMHDVALAAGRGLSASRLNPTVPRLTIAPHNLW